MSGKHCGGRRGDLNYKRRPASECDNPGGQATGDRMKAGGSPCFV